MLKRWQLVVLAVGLVAGAALATQAVANNQAAPAAASPIITDGGDGCCPAKAEPTCSGTKKPADPAPKPEPDGDA